MPYNHKISPLYELTYIGLSYSAYVTIGGFCGIDGMFIGICLHLAGQFEIIQSEIDTLIDNEDDFEGIYKIYINN